MSESHPVSDARNAEEQDGARPRKNQMGAFLDILYELRLRQLGINYIPREVWASEMGVSNYNLGKMFWVAPSNRRVPDATVLAFLDYLGKVGISSPLLPSDVREMLDRSLVEAKSDRVVRAFAAVLDLCENKA